MGFAGGHFTLQAGRQELLLAPGFNAGAFGESVDGLPQGRRLSARGQIRQLRLWQVVQTFSTGVVAVCTPSSQAESRSPSGSAAGTDPWNAGERVCSAIRLLHTPQRSAVIHSPRKPVSAMMPATVPAAAAARTRAS